MSGWPWSRALAASTTTTTTVPKTEPTKPNESMPVSLPPKSEPTIRPTTDLKATAVVLLTRLVSLNEQLSKTDSDKPASDLQNAAASFDDRWLLLSAETVSTPPTITTTNTGGFQIGDAVMAIWPSNQLWYPAHITQVDEPNRRVHVRYDADGYLNTCRFSEVCRTPNTVAAAIPLISTSTTVSVHPRQAWRRSTAVALLRFAWSSFGPNDCFWQATDSRSIAYRLRRAVRVDRRNGMIAVCSVSQPSSSGPSIANGWSVIPSSSSSSTDIDGPSSVDGSDVCLITMSTSTIELNAIPVLTAAIDDFAACSAFRSAIGDSRPFFLL